MITVRFKLGLLILFMLFFCSPAWAIDAVPGLTGIPGIDTRVAYANRGSCSATVDFNEGGDVDTITRDSGCGTGFDSILGAGDLFEVIGSGSNDDVYFMASEVTADTITLTGYTASGVDVVAETNQSVTIQEQPTPCIPGNEYMTSITYGKRNTESSTVPVALGGFETCNEWKNNVQIFPEYSGTYSRPSAGYVNVNRSSIGFYGEVAPSPGLELTGARWRYGGSDTLISHIRFAAGDSHDWDGGGHYTDTLHFGAYTSGLNADKQIGANITARYGMDGSWDIGESEAETGKIVIANSIVGPSLDCSYHSEGCHATGMAFPTDTGTISGQITLFRVAFLAAGSRTPLVNENEKTIIYNTVRYRYNNKRGIRYSDELSQVSWHSWRGNIGIKDNVADGDLYYIHSSTTSNSDIFVEKFTCYDCSNDYSTLCPDPPPAGEGIDNYGSPDWQSSEPAQVSTSSFPALLDPRNMIDPNHAGYILKDIGARPRDRGDPGASEGPKDWIDFQYIKNLLDRDGGGLIDCVNNIDHNSYDYVSLTPYNAGSGATCGDNWVEISHAGVGDDPAEDNFCDYDSTYCPNAGATRGYRVKAHHATETDRDCDICSNSPADTPSANHWRIYVNDCNLSWAGVADNYSEWEITIYSDCSATNAHARCTECSTQHIGYADLTANSTTHTFPDMMHDDSGDGYTNVEKWIHKKRCDVEFKPSEKPIINETGGYVDDGEQNVDPATRSIASYYDHVYECDQSHAEWEISESNTTDPDGSFSTTVYAPGDDATNKIVLALSGKGLQSDTLYYWHVRHKINNDSYSKWMNTKSFNTGSAPPQEIDINVSVGAVKNTELQGTAKNMDL